MARLSVRVTDGTLARLDALAAERGLNRARLVRELIVAALGRPPGPVDTPTEEELLQLLGERARAGNVAAIRALLTREEELDPRERALRAFEAITSERRS
jgi:Ribbon-helix-helix protein, copG family